MIRSFNPDELNYFLNHSRIYPNIAPDGVGYLDGSKLLTEENYFFTFPYGCLLFLHWGDGVYKGDCYFLPRKRGALAKKSAQMCIQYMFERDAKKIIAEVPYFNAPSRYFVKGLGFNRTDVNRHAWRKNGVLYDVIIYELEKK